MTKLRERILNAKDLGGETLTHKDLPEWLEEGESVLVQSITEATRRQLLKDCANDDGTTDEAKFTPALLIETLCDPTTKETIFARTDRDPLAGKSVVVIERVLKVALRVCGFTQPDVTEGNSGPTQGSATASALPNGSTKASGKSRA